MSLPAELGSIALEELYKLGSRASQGLIAVIAAKAKSRRLRVATTMRWRSAVAAIRVSIEPYIARFVENVHSLPRPWRAPPLLKRP